VGALKPEGEPELEPNPTGIWGDGEEEEGQRGSCAAEERVQAVLRELDEEPHTVFQFHLKGCRALLRHLGKGRDFEWKKFTEQIGSRS